MAGLRQRVKEGELSGLSATSIDTVLDALMAEEWGGFAKPCLGRADTVVAYPATATALH
ncbi:MAG: hypothetical protein R3F15_13710 [Lysobacterales bacterium]